MDNSFVDYEEVSSNKVGIFKRVLFFLALSIILGGMLILAFSNSDNNILPSEVSPPPAIEIGVVGEVAAQSPTYRDSIQQENDVRSRDAIESGDSSVDMIITTPEMEEPFVDNFILRNKNDDSDVLDLAFTEPMFDIRFEQQLSNEKHNAMREQMGALLDGWTALASSTVKNNIQLPDISNNIVENNEPSVRITNTDISDTDVLIRAGTILYAEMQTSANSDVGGPVVAEMVGGPAARGKLIGSFERKGNYLNVVFNRLQMADQPSVTIEAVALDLAIVGPGVRSSINHRYIQRYGLPLIASFLQGFGAAASRGSSVTSSGPNGIVTFNEGSLTSSQQIWAGVGSSMETISGDLTAYAQEMGPLVKLEKDDPVGILFLNDVRR